VLSLTSFLLAAALGAQPAPLAAQDRLTAPLGESVVTKLPGSLHPLARTSFDLGRVDGAVALRGVSLYFRPSAAQEASLAALLAAQRDPASPSYRRWITPEQFAERFGLTTNDLGEVSAWLRSQGFTGVGASRSRTRVSFDGTVSELESAFRTEIHFFDRGGETHFANATELSLPGALVGLVSGVRNLDDFRPRPRAVRPLPDFTSSVSGSHFLVPDDFATIYDLKPLYQAGLDGTGESIAVVGQTEVLLSDIDTFRALSGLSVNEPKLVLVPNSGNPVIASGDETEADLDLEWSGAIARNARVLFVYTGNNTSYNAFDALQYAVDNDLAPVISVSYGNCEANADPSLIQNWAQQANAQGQTIAAASGDAGAADCDLTGASAATLGLAVDVPASIPEVTGVGGTEFVGDASSSSGSFSAQNDFANGSALGYISEEVWNDTAAASGLAASGGGVSSVFPAPSWQTGTGQSQRAVPDVAFNASPLHDPYLICETGFCVSPNGYRDGPDGHLEAVGGTSAAAPSFAGILAILNQAAGSGGLGNVNPSLYALAKAHPSAFHTITTGNNIVPCTLGSTGCPASGQYGYSASSGYSPTVGLGSVDATALVTLLAGTGSARAGTSTTLSPLPQGSIASGTPITLSVSVTSSATSAAIAGSVQFLLDGAPLGSPVVVKNGTATTVAVVASGTHAVYAAYAGDVHYAPSTSATQGLNVAGSSVISISGATTTVPGGSLTFLASSADGSIYPMNVLTWSFLSNESGGTLDNGTAADSGAGGRYTAGRTGGVTDVIEVVDALNNQASIAVTVEESLALSGSASSTPPKGSISFAAQGGTGTGYTFTLSTNNSGGSVEGAVYTAGSRGDVLDVVSVTDSGGNVASTNVLVGPPIMISPPATSVVPGGKLDFTASGGSGSGYAWSLASTGNGSSIDATTGAYLAGPRSGVSDVVEVVDSLGNAASANVSVTDAARGSGCGSAGGGAGVGPLIGLALASFALGRRIGPRPRATPRVRSGAAPKPSREAPR